MSTRESTPESNDTDPGNVIKATRFRPPTGGPELPTVRIPWTLSIVIAVLATTVWAAWFVWTARSVAIKVTPDIASVFVEEWLAPRVGNHWLLRPGQRRIRVEAPGYTTFSGTIKVGDAPLQTQQVTLQALPGHLRIEVAPVARARVYIDGSERGSAPGTIKDIAAGPREIQIRAPRYQTFVATIEVEGKGIEQNLTAVLDPAWAAVAIDSKPSGAQVIVDGENLGETPLDVELLQGRRVVQIKKAKYKRWQQTLKIVPGNPVNLGEIVLIKADGRLKIDSSPRGASVTVDGQFEGRTPIELALTPDKKHRVRLLKEGFKSAERTIELESEKLESMNIELAPELATIRLLTSPEDAELLINGTPSGSATQTLNLPTHEHRITVRRAGYATYETTITPRKGVEKRFKIRLRTEQEMARAGRQAKSSKKGFATTFAGQEMKLFTGGRIVMGSSRRESGRRANEVQREVTLKRPFYLSIKEVTNGEFRKFLASHQSKPFEKNELNKKEQPVADISWELAATYCNWLSRRDGLPPFYQIKFGEVLGINPDATGYRLPTEAEWEWVARVPPKGTRTIFPWGEKFPPRGRSGNYADSTAANIMGDTIEGYSDGFAVAAPVGSFAVNLRGLYDTGGNVAEWVHDYYDAAPSVAPSLDPLGPAAGAQHVIKGSSWAHGSVTELRLAYRDYGGEGRDDLGFRLARYAQ
ncbi:MAG: PEGA domain-containing protein [Gammaproteobacteria bacterium]|nr:PEGA domain-containing protein [Gammaproteobacteria bacterium]